MRNDSPRRWRDEWSRLRALGNYTKESVWTKPYRAKKVSEPLTRKRKFQYQATVTISSEQDLSHMLDTAPNAIKTMIETFIPSTDVLVMLDNKRAIDAIRVASWDARKPGLARKWHDILSQATYTPQVVAAGVLIDKTEIFWDDEDY